MRNILATISLLALGLTGCGTASGPDRDGITRGPAPYAALTSGDEALKVVFDQVCLPAVLDGGDFVTLAKSHYLVADKPPKDSTGQSGETFALAAMAHAYATRWADGSCMITIERGDASAYRAHVLAALAEKGQTTTPGIVTPVPNGGVRSGFCNPDPRPLILAMTTPDGPKSKRPAIVATLYRAKGGASDICKR
jgi:hypothetical protein